jgi:hypothetical protein
MKYILFLCLFLIPLSLFAFEGIYIGVGAEGNAHTRAGRAVGGGISLGFGLSPRIALGVKAMFHTNFDTVTGLEPVAFFRIYPAIPGRTIFAQGEAGAVIYNEYDESYPEFLAAIAVGWRFAFRGWYIEPSVRQGWPFAVGAGLTVGITL